MGLSALTAHTVRTPFTLTDQGGRPTPVPARPPRVVVAHLLRRAVQRHLPRAWRPRSCRRTRISVPAASDVEFVTVNTDPTALAQSAEAARR